MQRIIDRFVRYIQIDTQSDPENPAFPSTEKQWNLAHLLAKELNEIGMQEVSLDENCYLMATLPSNVDFPVPTIGFIAHLDTSPDYSGANVNPQFFLNYNGQSLVLNENFSLTPDLFPELLLYKGQTIITTDGTTLLGADDKAGIAEIVSAMDYLIQHPEIEHGKIRIGFTPDEEVGKGAHLFDIEKFGAEWAYTMDGSQVGELEYENFNAAKAKVSVRGKAVHPGYAKGKMRNSILIANEFISALPKNEIPQETDGFEGFFHVHDLKGDIEKTEFQCIIRDHNKDEFEKRKILFRKIADNLNLKLGEKLVEVELTDQYFNMREKIEPVMHIIEIAENAMRMAGIRPVIHAIRGGTDGAQLSYKGLPCPNIFAGGHNFHGRYEFIAAESMKKATDVIVNIAKLTTEKANKK
jgi:tripeptide aminopeptidase